MQRVMNLFDRGEREARISIVQPAKPLPRTQDRVPVLQACDNVLILRDMSVAAAVGARAAIARDAPRGRRRAGPACAAATRPRATCAAEPDREDPEGAAPCAPYPQALALSLST